MSRFCALLIATLALASASWSLGSAGDGREIKFADCPEAVRKGFQAEAKGFKIETVTKEEEDGDTLYWADVTLGGVAYSVGLLDDGTLSEMNLAVHDEEVAFDACPAAVKATFQAEAFGIKVEKVGKDVKYGAKIFEAIVKYKEKSYEIVVAEDGTLVEKVLIIDDEEVQLSACPAPVQAAFREHAKGGAVRDVTRSSGITQRTYEAEVEIKKKVYLIEVAESGRLISKSLEAGEE